MHLEKTNTSMEEREDQTVDALFGQSKAFALNDKHVNPDVIRYLNSVRQEALRTTVASIQSNTKYKASIYDEDHEETETTGTTPCSSGTISNFQSSMPVWIEWFNEAKRKVLEKGDLSEGYDERTINLLLHYLKKHLRQMPEQKGIVLHLLNILNKHPDMEEDRNLEMDEQWPKSIIKKLRNKPIKEISDIKRFIIESNEEVPMGFKQWYQFLQKNEPTHASFSSTINSQNIWILVQYMNQEWLKDIIKYKKPAQAIRFSNWLMYILFHLPLNVTANSVSNLRDLGKKCQTFIKQNTFTDQSKENGGHMVGLGRNMPAEMVNLQVPLPPPNLDITNLTLSVIAIVYRQRDLIL